MPEKGRTIEEIAVNTIETMHADMIGTKYKWWIKLANATF